VNSFMQFFKSSKKTVDEYKHEVTQGLMRKELEASRDIFGTLPSGVKRDFFCLDEYTWIWYEEWVGDDGRRKQMTTRYMIRPNEIVKSQNGGTYKRLSASEAKSLTAAVQAYTAKVNEHIYSQVATN